MHKSYQCEKKLFSTFWKEEEEIVYCYCMIFSKQDEKEKCFVKMYFNFQKLVKDHDILTLISS